MERLTKEIEQPSLYSYIVAYDYGNAPNPDFNICTLAICKPVIRRCAKVGDIILGLSPKRMGNHIVYCMVIDEIVEWQNYYQRCKNSTDLNHRIPINNNHNGDCIWIYQENGDYGLLPSKSGHTREDDEYRDLHSGKRVLIGRKYWYFGSNHPCHYIQLPNSHLLTGRGHRKIKEQQIIDEFILFFNEELKQRKIYSSGKYGNYFE
ncbi:Nmad2 family putative nucleotide modification protein [Ursidibacter arcticus]